MSRSSALHHVRQWLLMAAILGRGGQLRADDPPAQSPTAEERAAVAALADTGASLTINGDFQVVSVSLSTADGVKDDTLVQLRHLPHLQTVSITADNLTDAALKHLEGLKHLRLLSIRNSTFSAEALEKLQAALPECRISRSRSGRGFAGFAGAQGGPRDPEAARAAFEAARAAAQQPAPANPPGVPVDADAARAAALQRAAGRRGGFSPPAGFVGGRGASGFGFSSRSLPSPLLQELFNTDVQIELQITSEQWKLVETMRSDAQAAQQELIEKLRAAFQNGDRTAVQEQSERLQAAVQELRTAADERLKALLTAEQFQRLQQLAWQTAGMAALLDAAFAGDLDLSDAQRSQIDDLRRERLDSVRELMLLRRQNGEPLPDFSEIVQEDVWNERLLALFTDEQRARYVARIGPPRESADEHKLAQHAFALLDTNGNDQIDEAEWNSENAGRFLATVSPRAVGAPPLSRDDFVQIFVAARQQPVRTTRPVGF